MIQVKEVYTTEPTATEAFFANPTNIVLMGILALLAVGIVLHLRRKSS